MRLQTAPVPKWEAESELTNSPVKRVVITAIKATSLLSWGIITQRKWYSGGYKNFRITHPEDLPHEIWRMQKNPLYR